ncbi:MAG TPA: ABC transporter ATP-binding protein [Ktedonobacterales bacterium]
MAGPLVTCENLVKIYKQQEANIEVVALQGLDLEVRAGELLAIVGRSGSGKTTLMNILGALDQPSAGQCSVAGHALTRLGERERNAYRRFVVGHVWQQSGRNLVGDLTLAENVGLPQMLAGVSGGRRARRSAELLERVGLGTMAKKRPEQLSGGEQQRGAVAVALANGPRVLLADEPTGELDAQTAAGVVALLRDLTHTLGLTVILVTHDPAVAAAADRTIAIRDGRTSTETVRREQPAPPQTPMTPTEARLHGSDHQASEQSASAVIGLPASTHRESVLVDRAGRLQLPEEALEAVEFAGRAELRILADHVELWPAGTRPFAADEQATGTAVIGLPSEVYRETVVIDRAGWLQLSEAALDRVPFGRHAAVRLAGDHVELWPLGVSSGGA